MPAAQNAVPSQPFSAWLDAAREESSPLIAEALSAAGSSLSRAAAGAFDAEQRSRLGKAAEALRVRSHAIARVFPSLLREEMSGASVRAAAPAPALSFETLELMDDEQIDDTVELVRGQQHVMAAVEADLVQLNALVSAAQGERVVRAGANPLRPEVWVRALHRALGIVETDAAVRATWMAHVSEALGFGLSKLYKLLCRRMREQGIAAASFGMTSLGQELRRAAAALPADDAQRVTVRDLKRLLASIARGEDEPADRTQSGVDPTLGGMTMPAAMEALQDMKRIQDVVDKMKAHWRDGAWRGDASGGGGTEGSVAPNDTPTQTLAREVARLMLGNVATDRRLLPEIQQLVRELEPALLRLVRNDQRFFVDKAHPARELLEEVTQRSLAWPDAKQPGFAQFLEPLREAVQVLSQLPMEDADPFTFALQTLRQAWAESEQKARRLRAASARTLIRADVRNHAAAELAAELGARPDVAHAPAEVRRFLLGPWCQVMAADALAAPRGSTDPKGYRAIVNDLIWVSQPRLASQNPARLASLAASLRATLVDGLAGIGYSERDARRFLDYLAAAGSKALHGDTDGEVVLPPETVVETPRHPREPEAAEPAGHVAWLSPKEMADSRLMQLDELATPVDFGETRKEEAAAPASPSGISATDIKPGQYVEVAVRGNWTRWRLTWASPHELMLMFTNGQGQPESMTRQMFDKMVELGAVRLLPARSVVDGALDAVAQAALDNSIEPPR